MIQRIQTIYLLLLVLAGTLLYFFPVFTLIPGGSAIDAASYSFSIAGVDAIKGQTADLQLRFWPLIVIQAAILVIGILAIFLYKTRKKQMQLCSLGFILVLVLITLIVYDTEQLRSTIGPAHNLKFNWAGILLLVELISIRFAGRAIKKDDDLVRSADRLR